METISFKQYLASTDMSSEDKRYCMNFCKKMEYLDYLKKTVAENLKCNISTGYGNVNSKICFVLQNEKAFNLLKPLIKDILDKFNINFWDVYVTFVDKTEVQYQKKYSFLLNELLAVSPSIIFAIDGTFDLSNALQGDEINKGIKVDKYFNISSQALGDTDEATRKELWKYFKFLINYKDIE